MSGRLVSFQAVYSDGSTHCVAETEDEAPASATEQLEEETASETPETATEEAAVDDDNSEEAKPRKLPPTKTLTKMKTMTTKTKTKNPTIPTRPKLLPKTKGLMKKKRKSSRTTKKMSTRTTMKISTLKTRNSRTKILRILIALTSPRNQTTRKTIPMRITSKSRRTRSSTTRSWMMNLTKTMSPKKRKKPKILANPRTQTTNKLRRAWKNPKKTK